MRIFREMSVGIERRVQVEKRFEVVADHDEVQTLVVIDDVIVQWKVRARSALDDVKGVPQSALRRNGRKFRDDFPFTGTQSKRAAAFRSRGASTRHSNHRKRRREAAKSSYHVACSWYDML